MDGDAWDADNGDTADPTVMETNVEGIPWGWKEMVWNRAGWKKNVEMKVTLV